MECCVSPQIGDDTILLLRYQPLRQPCVEVLPSDEVFLGTGRQFWSILKHYYEYAGFPKVNICIK